MVEEIAKNVLLDQDELDVAPVNMSTRHQVDALEEENSRLKETVTALVERVEILEDQQADLNVQLAENRNACRVLFENLDSLSTLKEEYATIKQENGDLKQEVEKILIHVELLQRAAVSN